MSQEELAGKIGVTTNTVSRWETSTYRPSIEELDKLSRFFNVPISDFFPKEQESIEDKVHALMRAAKDLPDTDLEELKQYAEYRRGKLELAKHPRTPPGRKRK